jgi:hypothetical protein
MPVRRGGGMPEKKASKAASPPAEAPMPTMGKAISGEFFGAFSTSTATVWFFGLRSLLPFAALMIFPWSQITYLLSIDFY